jgi:glycerate dehydrogenase
MRQHARSISSAAGSKVACIMNKGRVDFDGRLDFDGPLRRAGVTVKSYETDYSGPAEIVERAQGASVLITKEVPVCRDAISALPETVELICEGGTGFNNIDLPAARARGIT